MGDFGGRKGNGKLYNYTIIPKVNGKKNIVHLFRKDTMGRKCEVTGHTAPSQETKQKGTVAKPKPAPNGSHPPPPQCSGTSQNSTVS